MLTAHTGVGGGTGQAEAKSAVLPLFVLLRFLLLYALLILSNGSIPTCPSFNSYYFKCFTHLTHFKNTEIIVALMAIRGRLRETIFNACIMLYILKPLVMQRSLSLIEDKVHCYI
uniref:Uncharacterized protein n=1 Tax=Rhipicephalus zambeziensis TaxID=60191 RepID=A0A224Y940_9ACAR